MTESYIVESSDNRIKVTIPVKLNWALLWLFTIALAVWVGMLITVIIYLIGGRSSSFVLTVILLIWMLIWFWFGRFLWRRWQYHAATREILFIDSEQIVLRRPFSVLGITTTYDLNHISPFYYSDNHRCPAFDYAYLHVYFGRTLEEAAALKLIGDLNLRQFPEEEALSI